MSLLRRLSRWWGLSALSFALLAGCSPDVSSDESVVLGYALSTHIGDLYLPDIDYCIDSATARLPQQRFWADIVFFDGGSRHIMASDPEFERMARRFFRARAGSVSSLPATIMRQPRNDRVSFAPGWSNALFCDHRSTFYTPVFDGDMAFVVAEMPHILKFWVFVRRNSQWEYLAGGHT